MLPYSFFVTDYQTHIPQNIGDYKKIAKQSSPNTQ